MSKKYQEFNVGRAGSGAIDLATGNLTFIHSTTDAESTILPVAVSHVYQSELAEEINSLYGRGWKLNLNQTLRKFLPDDPNDTRYVYTDGSGTSHEFEEKYFYRVNKEKNYYIPNTTIKIRRSDMKIDLDGRMWLLNDTNIEVFSELVTDSGLILHIRPKGFEGSKKIETRHEELVRVENEIKSISRQIQDLETQIEQNSDLEVLVNNKNHEFNSLHDLQQHIQNESSRMERLVIENFNNNLENHELLKSQQAEFSGITAKGVGPAYTITQGSNGETPNRPTFDCTLQNRWTHKNHNARIADSVQTRIQWRTGRDQNTAQGGRIQTAAYHQRIFQEACERLQQEIQEISGRIESCNWENQKQNIKDREALMNFQAEFQNIQRKFEEERLKLMLTRWNEDLNEARIKLARREHTRSQLINLLPVNYIIDDNILGFNEDGKLVAIFDSYDNQVAIMYEDDRIIRVIDSEDRTIEFEYINNRLDHIKDFQERITYFKYDLENRLQEIIYHDREISTFTYNDKHILNDMMPPSKIGKRIILDNRQRVVQIISRSMISKISSDGIEKGDEHTEDLISFEYDFQHLYTTLIRSKTKEQVTYFFNSDGEVIHEHIEGRFEQHFITYYENEEHEVVIDEEICSDSDISKLKEQHLKWSSNPETLPSFREKLIWQVTYLDGEGNPIKRLSNETSLPSDETIRQKIEETFTYKHFIDGRQPLLVRSDTLVTTTNEDDRNLSEEYFYDKQGSLIRTVSLPDQIVEETGYNNKGIIISSIIYHRSNPDKCFIEKAEVNEEGQMIASFDESGKYKTTYDYIKSTSKVNKTTDPRGGRTVLGRDFANNKINSMSSTSNGERNATTYNYTTDFLTRLESSNTKFEYVYDGQGRKTAIYVNGEAKPYVTYEYTIEKHNANNQMGLVECDVVKATYTSEEVYTSYTDKFERLLSIHYKEKDKAERIIITNFYDEQKLIKTLDYKTNETILFEYDIKGNVIRQTVKGLFDDKVDEIPVQHLAISQDININGGIDKLTYEIDNRNQIYGFDYDKELLTQIHLPSNDILKIDADDFGRVKRTSILSNDESLVSDELFFLQHKDHTTNLINSHTQRIGNDRFNKTFYTYDENGNIVETRQAGQVMVKYTYDELNRLIREDNRKLDKSYIFEYDNNGNILLKKEFEFTLDRLNEGILTNYTYSIAGDKLMSFNDELFEYDILGNPIVYRNNNLKWSHLRNLEKFNNIEFKYNSTNLRVYKDYQKVVDGFDTRFESRYQWANGKLLSETRTSTTNSWSASDQQIGEQNQDFAINTTTTTLDFIYDTNNKIGFTLNNEKIYYYVKNIQGDVLKIIDSNGNVVAEYTYDAWGNHEIISSIDGIAELNPIRYRSYYFDEETSLYYLKSRYYDSQVGRFINMDALNYVDPDNIGGLNLYAYCGNNPVMNIDPDGNSFWRNVGLAILGTVIVVGFIAATILTKGAFAVAVGKKLKATGAKVAAGAKKAGLKAVKPGFKNKKDLFANIAKVGVQGVFGFISGGYGTGDGWSWSGAFAGLAIGLGSGLIGGTIGNVFRESGRLARVFIGAAASGLLTVGKGLIKGSQDLGSILISMVFGGVLGGIGKVIGLTGNILAYGLKTIIEMARSSNRISFI